MADHPDAGSRRQEDRLGARGSSDTIAAIATAQGRAGIGVVRLSGPSLARLAREFLGKVPAPRRATRAHFLDGAGATLDDGIALFFPGPHSYTGEDVLELHGHGGPVVLQLLLTRALELGARVAEPGEFTRRAFLNDKLDLAQAEAVADVIEAATEEAARCAVRTLQGDFSTAVRALTDRLIELRMLVEATLDFPEEELDPLDRAEARRRLVALREALATALSRARQGSLLRSGMTVVLAGQPNVGKSSLLNRLAGEELAIVTALPGTTRDTIRQAIQIEGIPLNVVDTAGLREAQDEVERIGIARTWNEIERAHVLLLVVDARAGVGPADEAIVNKLPGHLRRLVVHNKVDLVTQRPRNGSADALPHIFTSARTGAGLDELRVTLLRLVGWESGGESVYMARERHLHALRQAGARLDAAERVFGQSDLLAEELRLAQRDLESITGEFSADDLLGEIFARFCIGK
jgi:tRNA modification GTPase